MYDTAEITVRAGNGGDGAVSFRHEKYVPFGGPDGGDGGNGGNVVIVADRSITNLLAFRRKVRYRATHGGNGSGRKRHGARGRDVVLSVPVGTVVLDRDEAGGDIVLGDLEVDGRRVEVVVGGRGGRGNTHFASSTNQTPRLAQKGDVGEERFLRLELRLIADVGIVGYPNAGKSTLLATASAAKPKIADYPFTTTDPIVGIVAIGHRTFVLAEIPGLIEGAHSGRGLGHDFLRHATRTRVLIHLVDGSAAAPADDLATVNSELGLFDTGLAGKSQLVAVNKIDLPEVRARLPELEATFGAVGIAPAAISAATGEGVSELMRRAFDMLAAAPPAGFEVTEKVFRPQPRGDGVAVERDADGFRVAAPELERLVARADLSDTAVRLQLRRRLGRLGVNRALKKAGAVDGDRVRCGDFEWEY
ncbi:MAG: GTPase ObgE [Dehalococcoidales bacterium]